jgi:hypothetical protein
MLDIDPLFEENALAQYTYPKFAIDKIAANDVFACD